MLDANLKAWLLEVNHLPSFNSDTSVDEQVKLGLLKDLFEIQQLSITYRKKMGAEIKQDQMEQQQKNGFFKRLSAKEHSDKVKFDPNLVQQQFPQNKFSLIYPSSNEKSG